MLRLRESPLVTRISARGLSHAPVADYHSCVGIHEGFDPTAEFEQLRPSLLGLAYRMLGTLNDAEDIVQEAWIRWQDKSSGVRDPRAYLNRTVVNLCLNVLDSANHKRLDYPNRLPEPIDLDHLPGNEQLPEVSESLTMGFMVLLQKLSPAERAVFVLHEVFDYTHSEIADMLEKSPAASRKLLERARHRLPKKGREGCDDPALDYEQLLLAFAEAVTGGSIESLLTLMNANATLQIDAGRTPTAFGQVRNLPRPVCGRERVASFLTAGLRRGPDTLSTEVRTLNGRPALVLRRAGSVHSVLMLDYAGPLVSQVLIMADPAALQHIQPPER